jgi:hypothetical protein
VSGSRVARERAPGPSVVGHRDTGAACGAVEGTRDGGAPRKPARKGKKNRGG